MAKLKKLPSLAIIDGFRGKVDYYIYHPTCDPENRGPGIPCARKWPRSPGHLRAQAVMDQWSDFAYATQAWSLLSTEVQDAYRAQVRGISLSGRDLFTRSYLSGLYRYEHTPPAPPVEIDVGTPAIDRGTTFPGGYTIIVKENPANDTGALAKAAVFANATMTGTQIAVFEQVSPDTFTTRSNQSVDNTPPGYKQHAVNLAIETDDFIGIYFAAGQIDIGIGGEGVWYKAGMHIPCVATAFSLMANYTLSLFGES